MNLSIKKKVLTLYLNKYYSGRLNSNYDNECTMYDRYLDSSMLKNDKYYQNFFLIAADKYNFNFPFYSNYLHINLNECSEEKKLFEKLHQFYNEEIKKK